MLAVSCGRSPAHRFIAPSSGAETIDVQEELMVELTEAARAELRRWCDQPVVRVLYSEGEGWQLAPDTRRQNDVALTTAGDLPTLICSPELAVRLEGAILHYRGLADNNYGAAGLALLRPRNGNVRPEWSPRPTKQPHPRGINLRALSWLFRRRMASGSTTQNASP